MSSRSEASVSGPVPMEQTQPEYTDRQRMEYLFMTEVNLDVDEAVAQSTIDVLGGNLITES